MNYSPFVYALDAQDVAVTGAGTLDGQADEAHWWNWRGAGSAAQSPMGRNVVVRGVTIGSHGPDNDGCDPESCRDVLIERCSFDTGLDCIALKSGRYEDGRRLYAPIENVVIRDCEMRDGHGGVAGPPRTRPASRAQQSARQRRASTQSVAAPYVAHPLG